MFGTFCLPRLVLWSVGYCKGFNFKASQSLWVRKHLDSFKGRNMSVLVYFKKVSQPLLVCMLTAILAQSAQAIDLPFLVAGAGSSDTGFSVAGAESEFSNQGFSFPVGAFRSDSGKAFTLTFDPGTASGTFKGSFIFEGRRGKLATTFGDTGNGAASDGTFMAIPTSGTFARILFIAEFNPVVGESTGAFRRVTGGSLTMYALTSPIDLAAITPEGFTPEFTFSWFGRGYLSY